jgi:hypothetical protein
MNVDGGLSDIFFYLELHVTVARAPAQLLKTEFLMLHIQCANTSGLDPFERRLKLGPLLQVGHEIRYVNN